MCQSRIQNLFMKRNVVGAVFALFSAALVSAQTTAYVVPSGTVGNQDLSSVPQSLGMDFDVNSPISITSLGVFDSGGDGLAGPLRAHIYNRDSQASLASLDFTPSQPGTLVGGSRFKPLSNPLVLPAGFHGTVVVDYLTNQMELNGNWGHGAGSWTTDSGGGLISFVGSARTTVSGIGYPGVADAGPANRYAAGTFLFTAGSGPPSSVSHDLSRDFAIAAGNPNGVWSYGWQGTLGGPFNLFTYSNVAYDPAGVPAERWEKELSVPSVQHNNSTNTVVVDGGQGNFPPETTWFYPGVEGEPENFGVIRFTAPVGGGGMYDLATSVRPAYSPSLQRDTDFHVLKNGVELFGRALNVSDTAGYTNSLALAAGDTIDLVIGRGADNSFYWSGLKVEATLTRQTNEVSSLALVVPRFAETNDTVFGGGALMEPNFRHQQVYGSVEFPSGAIVIRELRFRPDRVYGGAFTATVANIRINMSTTQRNPSALSSTFAQNVGPDDAVVFDGALSLSSQFVGPANGPKAFDMIVPLEQPFLYDPAHGSLVIDIRNFSGSTASRTSGQSEPDSAARVMGSIGAATGFIDSGADAIQIIYSAATNLPPVIVSQPQSQTVTAGEDVTFTVGVSGSSPLSYQWRKGGTAISGATGSSLTLNDVQMSDAGSYSVVASNPHGGVTSDAAILAVSTAGPEVDHDLSRDFSLAGNPNGVWSYGRQDTIGGTFTLLGTAKTNIAGNGVPVLVRAISTFTQPAILHNDTTQTAITDNGHGNYPPETTWFAPGVQGQPGNYAVARFTVPAGGEGTYRLVTRAHPAYSATLQLDTDFHVARNDVEIFGTALSGTQTAGYTNSVTLAAGDTIDFAVGRGADNSYIWSGLKVEATLTRQTNGAGGLTLVVPRYADGTHQPHGASTFRDAWRYQQVYGSVEFPQQPILIRELRFRPCATYGNAFATTVANIQFNLSTTTQNPVALSPTLAENVGPDDKMVFQGPLSISSQFVGPAGGPKAFDIIVPLSQPFLYDPARGNLVVDIRNFSGSTASLTGGQADPDVAGRVMGTVVTATTGVVDSGADAIQIVYSPATSGLTLVVPRYADGTHQPHGASTFRDAWRYQQVYGSVEFPQQPILIRELRFRPCATYGNAFTTTVANIQFNLSTTTQNPVALSATLAQNVGPDDTVVFQGPLSISSRFVGPAGGPKAFDIIVPLSQPFLYDPAQGNLVVDIRNFSGSTASLTGGQADPDVAGRVMGTVVTATVGVVDSGADAIQIVYSPGGTNQPPPGDADHDLSRDFSLAGNPNGVWSYGRQDTIGGMFTLLGTAKTNIAGNGVPVLVRAISTYTQPAILHNDTTQTAITDNGHGNYPPETTWFAPGVQGQPGNYAVARFTVPAGGGGTYRLVTTARPAYSATLQLDADFHVARNDVEIFGAALSGTQTAVYTNSVTLAEGDAIDFAVGRGADNSYFWSGLKVEARLDLISTNPVSPTIVAQPESQSVTEGENVTFRVSVTGSSPLGYQWFKDGSAVDGATAATLRLNDVQLSHAGGYSVVVSNAYGVATSQAATLTVNPAPDYELSRDFAIAAGNPNGAWSYGWQGTLGGEFVLFTHSKYNYDPAGVPVEVWDKPDSVPAVMHNNSTSTVITDGGQGNFPPETTWFYPGVEGYPENFGVIRFTVPNGHGGTYDLATTARPAYDGPMQGDTDFHVLKNGVELFGRALAGTASATFSSSLALVAGDTVDLVIGRGADNSFHGSGLKIAARLDLASTNPLPPTIVSQPASQTVDLGATVRLGVGVRGSLPLSYRWRFNGTDLPQGTNSTLVLEFAQQSNAGQYQVIVSNAYGSATSTVATVTVRSSGIAPTISSQPSGTVVLAGNTVTLNVLAVGTAPLSYQWFRNGVALIGAISGTLTIPNAQPNQSGSYWVVVSNAFGSATSRSATVNIQQSTQGGTVLFGNSSSNLIYDVDGITPVPAGTSYLVQLYAGTNASSLAPVGAAVGFAAPGRFPTGVRTISSVPAGQVATVQVKVWETAYGATFEQALAAGGKTGASDVFTTLTGGAGSPPSLPVPLTGLRSFALAPGAGAVPPEITSHPVSQTIQLGQSASFSVAASGPAPLLYQWRLNGAPLAGATGTTLSITNAQNTHAGAYTVVVRNSGGAVTSQVATLTVETSRVLMTKALGSVTEGDLVAVPIDLKSEGDVAGMSFVLRYNPDFLSSPLVEWGSALDGALKEVNETALGELRFVFAFGSGTLAGGTQSVATVNLRARSVIADAGSQLALQILDISDATGDPIVYGSAAESGSVNIEDTTSLAGDNNANGRLDIGDATLVLRLLALLDTTRPWDIDQNDLNDNGVLDSGDAVKILRAVAGIGTAPAAAAVHTVSAHAGSGAFGSASLTPSTVSGNPGSLVTFQLRLEGVESPVAGAAFTLNYPAHVLRLRGAQDYRVGPLVPQNATPVWNVGVSGQVRFASSSSTSWPANNGVLAELTFEVLNPPAGEFAWPVSLSSVEVTSDGYDLNVLPSAGATFSVRPQLDGLTQTASGNVTFSFNSVGGSYVIEASTNLVNWVTLTNVVGASGSVHLADPQSRSFPRRFYRARIAP